MTVGRAEIDRPIGDDGVEQAPVGDRRRGEGVHRPAAAEDPGEIRVRGGVILDRLEVLPLGGEIVQGAGAVVHAGADGVDMRVLEGGQDHLAVQVDDPRPRPDVRPDLRVRSDIDDPFPPNRHRLGP
jgi:hypothetical protein